MQSMFKDSHNVKSHFFSSPDTPPSSSPHEDVTNDNEEFRAPPTPDSCAVSLHQVVEKSGERAVEPQILATVS